MFSSANKTTKTSPAVQQTAGTTFFRKAGEESFFGAKENSSFFKPSVQAKLTVSTPDDPQEKEADEVADKVMRMHEPIATTPLPEKNEDKLQRKEKEEEEVQAKQEQPLANKIQCKAEPEEKLQAKSNNTVYRARETHKEPELESGTDAGRDQIVNRKNISLYHSDVMRQSGRGPPTSSIPFEQTLASSKGGGSALPADTKTFMGSRFNADFSGVRVHTDTTAASLSRSVNAQAFAHGNDIYFNSGKFSPDSTDGKTLLAHELTHTVQQGASRSNPFLGTPAAKKQISRRADNALFCKSPPDSRASLQAPANNLSTSRIENKEAALHNKSIGSLNRVQLKTALSHSSVDINGTIHSSKTVIHKTTVPKEVQPKEIHKKQDRQTEEETPANKQADNSLLPVKQVSNTGGTIFPTISCSSTIVQLKRITSPQADPAFKGEVHKVKATAQQAKKHEPAGKKVKEAQSAAKPPANEKESKAKDKKVDEMAEQEPGEFDEAKFKAALREKIAALQLNTLQEAEDFKANNKAASLKGDVTAQVGGETDKAAGSIENKTKEAPATGSVQGKEVGPSPTVAGDVAAPAISGQQASPKPVPAEDVSLQQGSQSLDKQMADAKVTDKQLSKSNESKFTGALASKKTAQQDAVKQPVQFRKDEKGIITNAQAVATGVSKTQLGAIVGTQKQKMGGVLSKQEQAKAKDEADRAKIAADIEQKFNVTKTDVEGILSKLDTDVAAMFDQGISNATKSFEDYVDQEVRRYKIDRYLNRIGGSLLWAADLLLGLPDEVNDIYKRGKDRYIKAMDVVINKVAKLVVTQLKAAKKRIAQGKQEIKSYVEKLPKNLQAIGSEAAKNIQSQFSELEQGVNNKQNDLIDTLAAKYKAGLENVDKKIADMKEANKGLVDKAIGAIKEVIDAIIEFKNMLLNVLARAAAAIDLIIEDPIGFLGNLVAGVKQGIQAFVGNIATHLKNGLMGWLFGELAQAGIQMPKSFDAQGIMSLVLQVLGLTYANIRSRAVNIVGEKVVKALETAAEIFIIIKNEGIGGLWRFIKEKVEQLKDTVIDSIKSFVTEKIIVAGVTWLVSMLNPASAFIKACKMIYDVIMFFVTRGSQIMALVNAVIDSVTAIARGAIGVAASAVENALAKALPVAISFLASLLGLGGISEKIKAIIAKIQAPINAAIDWVINKAVALVKAAGKLLGFGKEKDPEKDKADKEERVHKGIIAADKALTKFRGKKIGKVILGPILSGIKLLYGLTSLEVVPKDTTSEIVAVINPTEKKDVEVELVPDKEKQFNDLINKSIIEASKSVEAGWHKDSDDKSEEATKQDGSVVALRSPAIKLQNTIERIRALYSAALKGPNNTFEVAGHTYFVDQVGNNYVYPIENVNKAGGPDKMKVPGKTTIKNPIKGFGYQNWSDILVGNIKALLLAIGNGAKIESSGKNREKERIAMLIASLAAETSRYPPAHITNLILLLDDSLSELKAFKTMSMTQGASDPSKGKAHGAEKVKDRQVATIRSNEALMKKMQEVYDSSNKTTDQLLVVFKYLIIAYINNQHQVK